MGSFARSGSAKGLNRSGSLSRLNYLFNAPQQSGSRMKPARARRFPDPAGRALAGAGLIALQSVHQVSRDGDGMGCTNRSPNPSSLESWRQLRRSPVSRLVCKSTGDCSHLRLLLFLQGLNRARTGRALRAPGSAACH